MTDSSDSSDQRVRLLHYDPSWPQEFQQTRSSLFFASEGWVEAIEHVGSTAISGLIAQPTIDVVAGIADQNGLFPAMHLIKGLNFRRRGWPAWADCGSDGNAEEKNAVLVKPRRGQPTHRVFLTQIGSPLWQRLLAMRDWLRDNPASAVDFEASKVDRWKACQGDPAAYREAKTFLFAELEERIEAERP